jgi:hypothetical protein
MLLERGRRLHSWLIPGQAQAARQKYAMGARLAGVVKRTGEEDARFAPEVEFAKRFQEAYAKSFEAAEKHGEKLQSEADAAGKATAEASRKLTTDWSGLQWGALSSITSVLDAKVNARKSPDRQKADAEKRVKEQVAAFAKEIGGFETRAAALHKTATALLPVKKGAVVASRKEALDAALGAEQKRIKDLAGAMASLESAYEAQLTGLADAEATAAQIGGPNADATAKAKGRAIVDAAHKKGTEAIEKARNAVRQVIDAGSKSELAAEAAGLVLDAKLAADEKATLIRSDALWKAHDGLLFPEAQR